MTETGQNAKLNTLIATLLDSVAGYEKAVGEVRDPHLTALFTARAEERRRAAEGLQQAVRAGGGEPEDEGSTTGAIHRVVIDIKQAITGSDDKALVNEIERGEDYLKAKFETALQDGTIVGTGRDAVQAAWESVRAGHDEMSRLKHSYAAPTA